MIRTIVEQLGGWTWWVVGALLLSVEVFLPGFFFLWFGIAAILIGVSALLIDWPWQAQIVGFAILSVVAALVGRRVMGNLDAAPADDPNLNRRVARFEGRTFTLSEAMVDGQGRVRIDDSTWRARGPDLPAGSRIRVVGHDGATLLIEPV